MSLIPNDYQLLSISNNGDNVVYVRSDSSQMKPKELIISRNKGAWVPSTSKFSIQQFAGNVSVGTVSGDPQMPQPEKLSLKVIARVPFGTPSGDIDTALADLRAFIDSDEFRDSIVSLMIPLCCPEEDAE